MEMGESVTRSRLVLSRATPPRCRRSCGIRFPCYFINKKIRKLFKLADFFVGGDGGNRTPVLKLFPAISTSLVKLLQRKRRCLTNLNTLPRTKLWNLLPWRYRHVGSKQTSFRFYMTSQPPSDREPEIRNISELKLRKLQPLLAVLPMNLHRHVFFANF